LVAAVVPTAISEIDGRWDSGRYLGVFQLSATFRRPLGIGRQLNHTSMKTLIVIVPVSIVALAALAPALVLSAPAVAVYTAAFILLMSASEYKKYEPRWQTDLRAGCTAAVNSQALRLAA
jgi:hypothetical protein